MTDDRRAGYLFVYVMISFTRAEYGYRARFGMEWKVVL